MRRYQVRNLLLLPCLLLLLISPAHAVLNTNENATYCLGEPNFASWGNTNNGAAGMNFPTQGIAYDTVDKLLWVADTFNNRVLAFNALSFSNGMNASYVLGQTNFTNTGSATTQSGMNAPYGLAYDPANQRLFVSDTGNNRVLVFNTAPTNGLLGWWRFDEGSGTSASDSSGNGNTGTLKNAPTWVTGQIGDALGLNGTNQYVDIANPSNFNFSANNAFTLTAWINRSSASNPDDEIINKIDQSTSLGYSFWMPNNGHTQACNSGGPTCTSNCLLFSITGTIGTFCAAAINTPAAAGAWHHVAVTYDGNNTGNSGINFYVDGALQTTTYTGNGAAAGTVTNANDLFIGIDCTACSGDYFNGKIDEVRVYSRALSASEVASIALTGENAANVIGEPNFTTGTAHTTQSGLNGNEGLAYDAVNNRLFVAEYSNCRVTVFNTTTITNGMNAANVLGEPNYTSTNCANSQSGIYRASGVAFDPVYNRLFVSDNNYNRVTVYNTSSITNGMNASYVLGQSAFNTQAAATTQAGMKVPTGVAYDTNFNRLFVADSNNNRVLVFNAGPSQISNGMNASWVLGQANFTTGTAHSTQAGLSLGSFGDVYYNPGTSQLFIMDYNNVRDLIFEGSYLGTGNFTPGYD